MLLSGFGTTKAFAEDIDIYPVADEFQQEVERTAAEYDEALAQVEAAEKAVTENAARLDELAVEIPEQQQRSSHAARELYKLEQQSSGLIELIFSSDSFYDLLVNFDYIARVTDAHRDELSRLGDMKAEFDERQTTLEKAQKDATRNARKANEALKAAQAAREEAQQRAREEAQRQAEEAAAAAAAAATAEAEAQAEAEAAAKAEEEAAQTHSEQSEPSSESASEASQPESASEPEEPEPASFEQPTDDGANWSQDQKDFVNEWSQRIDAYLAGSALAGQGATFAKAAWTYGVDPRWSPAIAFTESTLGANCFNPHNAWGWGSASWGSWEEAINDHVAGLARGYGYTISIEAAQKYCPPNWENWYNRTLEQMNKI